MSDNRDSNGLPIVPLLAMGLFYLFPRPQMLKWGTRLGESQRRLPGDELIPQPNHQTTHAINIDAPPEALWPWIAQMGRERTGYYSLDAIDNHGIPSVNFVRQDIPAPEVGMEMDGGFQIMELETNRLFLYGGFSLQKPPGITYDYTASYLLERRRDGSTRLLVRRRAFNYGLLGTVSRFDPVRETLGYVSSMHQLTQLKRLAESMAHLRAASHG